MKEWVRKNHPTECEWCGLPIKRGIYCSRDCHLEKQKWTGISKSLDKSYSYLFLLCLYLDFLEEYIEKIKSKTELNYLTVAMLPYIAYYMYLKNKKVKIEKGIVHKKLNTYKCESYSNDFNIQF